MTMLSLVQKERAGINIIKINKQRTGEGGWKKVWGGRTDESSQTFWQMFDHIVLLCVSLGLYFRF